jgi:hypothetical protein
MVILDKMIHAGRLTEFVQEVLRFHNQELLDKARWDYWLHRVYEMSFKDYVAQVDGTDEEVPSDEAMKTTIQDSMGIITGFCPS